jgi:hypothetical protein
MRRNLVGEAESGVHNNFFPIREIIMRTPKLSLLPGFFLLFQDLLKVNLMKRRVRNLVCALMGYMLEGDSSQRNRSTFQHDITAVVSGKPLFPDSRDVSHVS